PLAQTPGNPASSAIRALRPLWASMRKLNCGPWIKSRRRVVFRGEVMSTGRSSWFARRGGGLDSGSELRQSSSFLPTRKCDDSGRFSHGAKEETSQRGVLAVPSGPLNRDQPSGRFRATIPEEIRKNREALG